MRKQQLPEGFYNSNFKIRLKPTKKQQEIFKVFFGIHRHMYNWAIEKQRKHNELYKQGLMKYPLISDYDLGKMITSYIHEPGNEWILGNGKSRGGNRDIQLCRYAAWSVGVGYMVDIKNHRKFPFEFKAKRDQHQMFYSNGFRCQFANMAFRLSGIGWIKCERNDYAITSDTRIGRPAVIYDNGKYYIVGTIYKKQVHLYKKELEPVGIDVNVSPNEWIVDSSYTVVEQPDVSRLERRRGIYQHILSRKINTNSRRNRCENQTSNRRSKRELAIIRRISQIRRHEINMSKERAREYIRKTLKDGSGCVVIEDLKINQMIQRNQSEKKSPRSKRRFNRDAISAMPYFIRTEFERQCRKFGTPLIKAKIDYPSTQLCSCCGHRFTGDKKLKLTDREYKCPACGSAIDRDLNSSFNLKYLGWSYMNSPNFPESHEPYRNWYDVIYG